MEKLKTGVEEAKTDDIIQITGEITAAKALHNNGAIYIEKDPAIAGKTGKDTDKLNAKVDGKPVRRIFTVKRCKKLTIKNLTLTKGALTQANHEGGVIEDNTVNFTNNVRGKTVQEYF